MGNLSEVKAISRSIGKWVWQRDPYAEDKFIQRQTYKASLGGKAGGRVEALQMKTNVLQPD